LEAAEQVEQKRAQLIEEYRDAFANPYIAAKRGYLDDVVEPPETRARLVEDLDSLEGKRVDHPDRKHGNIPL
ncbi:methylmalonyl-CoA carboxyltransferase, partial [Halobacteriales archaeon QH_6_68_27]